MPRRRNTLLAAGALVIVLVVLALGFRRLGSPADQRAITADQRRVQDLRGIAQRIAALHKPSPPPALADLEQRQFLHLTDPVTRAPYEYHLNTGTAYQLCATFSTASADDDERWAQPSPFWRHLKGRYCYELDSSKPPDW
jgi:hypothetical protein